MNIPDWVTGAITAATGKNQVTIFVNDSEREMREEMAQFVLNSRCGEAPGTSARLLSATTLLQEAVGLFEMYAEQHNEKGRAAAIDRRTGDAVFSFTKAQTNIEMAVKIQRFLDGGQAKAAPITDEERAAVPADALLPSFEEAPADAVVPVSVPALTRALSVWDEESKDKGWPERDDENRHEQSARYVLGIIIEHGRWDNGNEPFNRSAEAMRLDELVKPLWEEFGFDYYDPKHFQVIAKGDASAAPAAKWTTITNADRISAVQDGDQRVEYATAELVHGTSAIGELAGHIAEIADDHSLLATLNVAITFDARPPSLADEPIDD